jgi:Galactose oxidase, central domain
MMAMKKRKARARFSTLASIFFIVICFSVPWVTATAQDQGTFTSTGSMTIGRAGHAAVLLRDGKVLVVGGWGYEEGHRGGLASAELYDPSTGMFTPTGTMTTPRWGPTATLLADGRVLVAGGLRLNSAELYDPATGTFSATGDMTSLRYGHAAILLPNGKVLIAGGLSFPIDLDKGIASAELYDPSTGSFSPTGTMNTAQFAPSATLLPNGTVLIASGPDFSGIFHTAQIYDAETETFTLVGRPMPALYWHTATPFPNGQVLLAGGGDSISGVPFAGAGLFDAVTATLSATGNMTVTRFAHAATLLRNGTVLITGGAACCRGGGGGGDLMSAEFYDPASGSFSAAANMTTARSAHTSTLLPDGRVLIAGGFDSLNTAELFSPNSN